MLLLYIFGPIGFTTLVIFAWVKIYRPWKKRRVEAERSRRIGQKIDELLARAEQGDAKAQDKLVDGGYRSANPVRKDRLEANEQMVVKRRQQERIQRDWKDYGEPAKKAYGAWQRAVGTREEPALFVAFVLAFGRDQRDVTRARLVKELGFDYEEAKSRLQKVVLGRYEMLAPEMLENQQSFLELRGLIPETRERYGIFRNASVQPLEYPDGWNEAVARFLENPAVEEFVGLGEGPAAGQVLQWGEEAFRDGDIVKAKIVLAYASEKPYWRAELGGTLNHELGKLVAEYHASLTVETSITVEPSV